LQPRDEDEAAMLAELAAQRSELNWFYHQLSRLPDAETPGAATVAQLRTAAKEREQHIAELVRKLQLRTDHAGVPRQTGSDGRGPELPLRELQTHLCDDTALIEYYAVQGQLLAFVVTERGVDVVTLAQPLAEIEHAIHQLRFQMDTLRHGSQHLQRQLPRLTERVNHYLQELHAALLAPLLPLVAGRRLAVVPYGALHYVPFPALHDGAHHLIELCEVCVVPSSGVLLRCLARPQSTRERVALIGAPDAQAPLLAHEIEALHRLMPQAEVRLGTAATVGEVRSLAPTVDVLHLACHGHFRPDNPMFSALQLADGRLTARDAYDLRLQCSLVTLSACETGINAVAPGEELLGLVRGFLAAGAPALLVSLWPVDDATTVRFMQHFYTAWLGGAQLAAAHRAAELALLSETPHPFFWSPFVLFGRWH
jgi:CHAT domain-containing protein